MGKVGKDAFGDMVQNILKGYHAGGGLLVDPKSSTSYSIVVALPASTGFSCTIPARTILFAMLIYRKKAWKMPLCSTLAIHP